MNRIAAGLRALLFKLKTVLVAVIPLGAIFFSLSSVPGQSPSTLVLTQTIPLPKIHGGFNHMSVDAQRQRLFVPAPADRILEIVDLKSGKPWRSVQAERPTTALYAPEFNQLYLTSGANLYIYDENNLNRIASINFHSRLDELQYDPLAKELYVGCMTKAKTGVAIVAIPEGRFIGEIRLPSSPQGLAVEKQGRLFVNLPDANYIAVIDRRQRSIIAKWPLKGAGDNFPIALDERDRRLFIACRTPPEMLVFDSHSGSIVGRVPCVGDADDMWYDAARRRIYVTGSEGFISVIQQQDASRYLLLPRVATAPEAANSVFSSQMQSLYIGMPFRSNQAAEIRAYTTR